jgi:hypothetical protein
VKIHFRQKQVEVQNKMDGKNFGICLGLQYLQHKGKGKTIPLQAWTDPKGSREIRLPDFKTIGT